MSIFLDCFVILPRNDGTCSTSLRDGNNGIPAVEKREMTFLSLVAERSNPDTKQRTFYHYLSDITPNGQVSMQYEDSSFRFTQKQRVAIVDVQTVNTPLQYIYQSNELQKEATVRKNSAHNIWHKESFYYKYKDLIILQPLVADINKRMLSCNK